MAGNTRELIKALCLVADEHNIYVTAKKSACVRGAEMATYFNSEEASNYLKFVRSMNGPPRPLGDVISNYLSQRQRIELIDQVIEAIRKDKDVDSCKVVELILKDREVTNLALSALKTFIEDRTDLTTDRLAEVPCSIL